METLTILFESWLIWTLNINPSTTLLLREHGLHFRGVGLLEYFFELNQLEFSLKFDSTINLLNLVHEPNESDMNYI